MSEQNKNGGAAFGATAESRAITHADNCWSWGAKHYKCAVREIRAKRAEVAAWRELSDRMEAVLDQLQAEIERLRAEVEGLHEQLRLATVDQVNAEAEANDARAENERLAKALSAYQAAVNKIDDRIEYSLPMPPETKAALYAILDDLTAALAKENSND